MKKIAQEIKEQIMVELSKRGSTLEELENAMRKTAAGVDPIGEAGKAGDLITSLFNLAGTSALGVGALAGLGGYAAYRANDDSTQKKLKKMREAMQYEQATRQIQDNLTRNKMM